MTYVIHCRALALVFFLPLFLNAQQTDSSATELPATRLREMVVQATRAGGNSPIPHSNLSAAAISKILQAQDVPILLTGTPSLVETSDAGTGIGYTGLRIRGSDPTRVNVTINGVPFNDAESQGVFWVNLPDLAASASEIQVQRGVGSSSNGAGAFGATVNLDLSRVQAEPGATVTGTVGAFGTRKFSAMANTGLLGKWSFSGRTSVIHSDGYIDRGSADLNSLHLTAAYAGERQMLQVHLLSGHEITYQAWNGVPVQFLDNDKLRTFNTAGTERPGGPYRDEVDDYRQQHLLLHYKRILTPRLTLQLNGHYTKGKGFYEQYKSAEKYTDYGLNPWLVGDSLIDRTNLIRRRWLDNDFYGGTFALRWASGGRQKTELLLGGAVSRYTGSHFGEIIWSENPTGQENDFRYYDNEADKRDANLYLKAQTNFTNRITAFADVQGRVVHYDFLGFDADLSPTDQSVEHIFFNPKVGVNWSLSNDWAAYGFFGIAHREPNRDDYTESSPSSRPKAEQMGDTELGLRYKVEKASVSANFFYMQYRDQLVLNGRINDVGNFTRTNIPDSYRAGVELEGNVLLGSRIQLDGNLSMSRNKIKRFTEYRDNWDTGGQEVIEYRNSDLAFSPNLVFRGQATVKLFDTPPSQEKALHISATIAAKHVGKQFLDNTSSDLASLPAYFTTDLRLNVDIANVFGKEMNIILALNNWLDERYSSNGWVYRYVSAAYDARPDDPYTRLESGDVYQQAGFFPQAGRHFMATFRVSF